MYYTNETENFFCITSKKQKKGMQIVSESFIKWLGENEHLSVKIFKQIIANYDRNRVLTVNYSTKRDSFLSLCSKHLLQVNVESILYCALTCLLFPKRSLIKSL